MAQNFLLLFFITCLILCPSKAFAEETFFQIEHLPELEENKIDIGRVALLFAKEAYSDLDVEEYSSKLDQMVKEIRVYTGYSNNHPEHRIQALNAYLFREKEFHYDMDDPYGKKMDNRYLNTVLDSKSGNCFSLPILYLALAQRLGYPVYPVTAPQHIFLRYVDARLNNQNIEATNGSRPTNEDYIYDMEIPERGVSLGVYMRTLSYKEFLAEFFIENAGYWSKHKNPRKVISYLKTAINLNPLLAEAYSNLGNYKLEMFRYQNTSLSHLKSVTRDPMVQRSIRNQISMQRNKDVDQAYALIQKANDMGIAKPLPKDYWIIQEQRSKDFN